VTDDEGGDPPCWAHLFDEPDGDVVCDGADDAGLSVVVDD